MPASDPGAQVETGLSAFAHALAGVPVTVLREEERLPQEPGPLAHPAALALPAHPPRLERPDSGPAYCHLPPSPTNPLLSWAMVAHASAHVRHGQSAQLAAGLKPLQLCLLALLEDARVEHEQIRECPGLRALWISFHDVTYRNSHNGFDSLLSRLSLSLLDPTYIDPHPWIVKVRTGVLDTDGHHWRVVISRPYGAIWIAA